MGLPLRERELEKKLVLGLTQPVYLQLSHLYLSVQCCLGDFFALVKNKDKPQGGAGAWTASHQGVGTAWAFGLLATSCFPKLSHKVCALFPAWLPESLLVLCPPVFNSFSSSFGWEGGELDCCVVVCFCCFAHVGMEVGGFACCQFRKWWWGQTSTKV